MSNALVDELETITKTFVTAIVAAMRRASLKDILSAGKEAPARPTRAPRLPRHTPEGNAARSKVLVNYIKSHPGTLGQDARRALGFPRSQWHTYISRAIKSGKLRKEGDRRGTKYWAV